MPFVSFMSCVPRNLIDCELIPSLRVISFHTNRPINVSRKRKTVGYVPNYTPGLKTDRCVLIMSVGYVTKMVIQLSNAGSSSISNLYNVTGADRTVIELRYVAFSTNSTS